jgi:hypothetical protein
MNWEQALENLADGTAVARADWEEDYLDARFGLDGTVLVEGEKPFTIVKCVGPDEIEEIYLVSDEDKRATDWMTV